MKFIQTDQSDLIQKLRSQLYQRLTAPIDAMWEQLYIASAQDYLIEENDNTIGYCCINDEHCLLQIFLTERHQAKMKTAISSLIELGLINSASLSSSELISFNTCLALSKSTSVNTFCFQHDNSHRNVESSWNIELVTAKDILLIKDFLKTQIGMVDTFGYTENLVSRKEIFMIKESDVLIATSERRISASQPRFSDVGIIVNKDFQGNGIATEVLQMQVNRILDEGREPICSTTVDNVASRKAIEKAGFYCTNVILDIQLT